ncbi:hypothetical protein [Caballeronia sp. ATUFL_M2_KS44]|uniref:hypothetical protein n=1 Tax=Caballeronia sp. ATUFL_M2_KS44 TaxID=2921767 RepID=UPI002028D784|nr:hypothetical protein [Caballeronia sp. ATUFL_M2_KS44]
MKKRMSRNELTESELETYKQALASSIRKDFIKKDVSYQNRNELKFLAGYRRERDDTMSQVRRILKEEFGASVVSVGGNMAAIVKRRD